MGSAVRRKPFWETAVTRNDLIALARVSLRNLVRALSWLTCPVIKSLRGAMEREDVRAAIVRSITVGGLTWVGFRAATHEPTIIEVEVSLALAFLAGVQHAVERFLNGPDSAPGQPSPPGKDPQ
jgi:hypothetical protein